MWKCSKCEKSVEDDLDICWNCGTSQDGTQVLDFNQKKEDAAFADTALDGGTTPQFIDDEENSQSVGDANHDLSAAELVASLDYGFICPKCNAKGSHVENVKLEPGTSFAFAAIPFRAVICSACGFTELYRRR